MRNKLFAASLLSIGLGLVTYWVSLEVSTQQFKRHFQQQFYQQFEAQLASTLTMLTDLAPKIDECNDATLLILRDKEFYDVNTRLIGWVDKQQRVCTSRPGLSHVAVNLPEVLHRYQYTQQADLNLIDALDGRSQLVLVFKHQGKRWFALLEPWSLFFSFSGGRHTATITLGEVIEGASSFRVGTLPVSIAFHTPLIHALLQRGACIGGVAMALVGSLLSCGFIVWRTNSARSPAQRLKLAIERGEIEPYFQFIVDARTGEKTHCEVFARWQQGGHTMMPNEFIPLAESTGHIDALLLSLIQQTTSLLNAHISHGEALIVSFNVSPSQLERTAFVEQLMACCQSEVPWRFALEITEREPFHSPEQAKETLKKLADLGVLLELDDAGTGYGSFSYIQELGFHVLKIDKMFVDTILQDNLKKNVLDGIIEFGHTAQITMIAEGVEQEEQARYLCEKGVFLHQGYYYGRPLDPQTFLTHLS